MQRVIFLIVVYICLAACVLLGVANPLYLDLPAWAQLVVAALVGIAVGGIAPRPVPGLAAWLMLAAVAWIGIRFAHGLGGQAVLMPAAASIGLASGLIAWRIPRAQRFWRPVPLFAGAVIVVALVLLGQTGVRSQINQPPGFQPFKAPVYALHLLDGKTVHSKSLANKTVVLVFWATWCTPCREELPGLQKIYLQHYWNDPRVAFYLVDVGDGADTRAKAREFLRAYGITLPAAFDAGGRLMDAFRLPPELPTRIVIGADGAVKYRAIGYGSYAKGFPGLRKAIGAGRPSSEAVQRAAGGDAGQAQNW